MSISGECGGDEFYVRKRRGGSKTRFRKSFAEVGELVLAGEAEDLEAGNGVEVRVPMHEDETCRVRDSGDESVS